MDSASDEEYYGDEDTLYIDDEDGIAQGATACSDDLDYYLIPDAMLHTVKDEAVLSPSTSTEPSTSSSATSSSSLKRKSSSESSEVPARSVRAKISLETPPPLGIPKTGKDIPVTIAYSQHLQHFMDAKKLPWGVQWEIARLATLPDNPITYDQIKIEWLNSLRYMDADDNSNAKLAPRTAKFIVENIRGASSKSSERDELYNAAFASEQAAKFPWQELDAEESALKKSPHGCLGLSETSSTERWYGGKIHFIGKLTETMKIVLQRPELGDSCRFTRRFGSSRFLRIKISQKKYNADLTEFFMRPFVIHGRVFRSFYAKDSTVFMFQTNEVVDLDGCSVHVGREDSISLSDFTNWHNPILLNKDQTMAKYAARMALGLSNSVPGIYLSVNGIKHTDEQFSPHWPAYKLANPNVKKPPSYMEMSDGCGYINRAGLQALKKRLGWDVRPTAIQCRVAGAKGLLMLHPDDTENEAEEPIIWIRPSQLKINYDQESMITDPALSIIDVLRASHMKTPSRLSAEVIVNMGENGVSHKVFIELMRAGLEKRVNALTEWSKDSNSLFRLWCNTAEAGGIFSTRLAREAGGEARAQGHRSYDSKITVDDDEDDDDDETGGAIYGHSSAWWSDQISGCPSSLEETVMVLVDSGFTPENCTVLRQKLKEVINRRIKGYVKKFNFEVPMSCSAWCVPDPYGVLEPGEIHVKSSKRDLLTPEGSSDIVVGDVLIYRNPCKLPTDVQKVKAVIRDELRNYVDVIVFSTKDYRHLPSLLAGGDSDGDKPGVIWDPQIVQPFTNADVKYADEPSSLKGCLQKDVTTVSDFLDSHPGLHDYQRFLLMALKNPSLVGTYSAMYDYAVYTLGYYHAETIRLAYMFCTVLDAAKTGLIVLPESYNRDRDNFLHRAPKWRESEAGAKMFDDKCLNEPNAKRDTNKLRGDFIMDKILSAAGKEAEEQKAKVNNLLRKIHDDEDADLAAPWKEAKKRASFCKQNGFDLMEKELDMIEEHARSLVIQRSEQMMALPRKSDKGAVSRKSDKGAQFTGLTIEKRQDTLREISRQFASKLSSDMVFTISSFELERLKASCAYVVSSRSEHRFAFDVATRQLCAIKAEALGYSKTVTSRFYERFTIRKSFIKDS